MEPIFAQIRTLCADTVTGVLEKVAKKYDLPFEDLRTEFVLPILSNQAPVVPKPAPVVPKPAPVVPKPAPVVPIAPTPVLQSPFAAANETRDPGMCTKRAIRGMCTRKALPGSCYCKLHGRIAAGEPVFKKARAASPEPVPEVPTEPVPAVPEPVPEPVPVAAAVVPDPIPMATAVVPEPAPEVPTDDSVMSESEANGSPPPVVPSFLLDDLAPKRSEVRKSFRIKLKAAPIVSTKMNDSIFGAAPDDIEIF